MRPGSVLWVPPPNFTGRSYAKFATGSRVTFLWGRSLVPSSLTALWRRSAGFCGTAASSRVGRRRRNWGNISLRSWPSRPWWRKRKLSSVCLLRGQGDSRATHSRHARSARVRARTTGEYAAARHASRLATEELVWWVREVRRDPHWREVVLLAAWTGVLCGIAGALLGI